MNKQKAIRIKKKAPFNMCNNLFLIGGSLNGQVICEQNAKEIGLQLEIDESKIAIVNDGKLEVSDL
jgi:hypothetical protein